MNYLLTRESIAPSVGKHGCKRLGPFFGGSRDAIIDGERLASTVSDNGHHSAISRVGEKTCRVRTEGLLVDLSLSSRFSSGKQFPGADENVIGLRDSV